MQSIVNIYQSDSQIVRDAIDKVVVQVYRKKREHNHISFMLTGCSAGCGTTYTAINLAVALANAGWSTVLVDCDIRKGMVYKRLNQDVDFGLSDYLVDLCDSPIVETNHENLHYIPCGRNEGSPVRLLCTKEMEKLTKELSEKYDFVIYDFPSIDIVPDAGIIASAVDDVILVAAINETGRKQLEEAKNKIKSYGDKYMGVIVNKLDMPEFKHYVKDYDYFVKNELNKRHFQNLKKAKKKSETLLNKTSNLQTSNSQTKTDEDEK